MSRSTVAKSRQDKTNKVTSAPTPAVTHEIVPGKFNDQDWNAMLDHDDGDDFIFGIMDQVCCSAMEILFMNYIERQLIPYTVAQAKDALLQIIEWQFLARDEGEGNVESDFAWAEDKEPEPAKTDCWAQGSVPRTLLHTPIPLPIQEEEEEEESVAQEQEAAAQKESELNVPLQLESEPTVIVEEETSVAMEETIQEQKNDARSRASKLKAGKPSRRGYKPHTGPMRMSNMEAMLTESLEKTEMRMMTEDYQRQQDQASEADASTPDAITQQMPTSCHSILKLQAGRPPGSRDVIYDAHGNVIAVHKLDPEKLPNHRIQLKFHVVDPMAEASRSRLEAMRKGKALHPHPPASPRTSTHENRRALLAFNPTKNRMGEGINPLPPPLHKLPRHPILLSNMPLLQTPVLDSMVLSPGVVVQEGDRVKKGAKNYGTQGEMIIRATERGLHAIHIKEGEPAITVSEILQSQQPIIKSIHSTPIPPISPSSEQRSQVC